MFPIAGLFLRLLSCTWKSVHYCYEPSVFSAFSRSRNFALVDFLGPSSTHSCECSRAGGAGVAGSLLPGDSAPGVCQLDCGDVVMTKEDFSKYEKLVLPPPSKKEEKKKLREEELWRQCQKEESLKKQVQMHLEQVKKHEHNLEQQKLMLADVQLRLESVSLEVKALRAWLRKRRSQRGSLFKPRCLLLGNPLQIMQNKTAPGSDLDMEATPLDSDDDGMQDRDAGSWLTVASNRKKRGKAPVVMKMKGSSASLLFDKALSTKRVFLRMICRAWKLVKLF